MATAKQVQYHTLEPLLSRRKHTDSRGPTVAVAFPLAISTRLSRLEDRRLRSTASIRRFKSTSLPRIAQPSAKPSEATTRSATTTTQSSSLARKTGSGYEASVVSVADPRGSVHETGASEAEVKVQEVLSSEEVKERRVVNEKCLKWLDGLPAKFSSMHVVQHVVYSDKK